MRDHATGLYARHIFPQLCDWSMRNPRIERRRSETLAHVEGEILEIGFGTGLNLVRYPDHFRHLTGIDPGRGRKHGRGPICVQVLNERSELDRRRAGLPYAAAPPGGRCALIQALLPFAASARRCGRVAVSGC
jgi:hypothetical protein